MAEQLVARRTLYPPIEPFEVGRLAVGDGHELYWEQSGSPDGQPVVFLHGGPGGGLSPDHRRFHDPSDYRIVAFEQRGCGRSTPLAALEANSTWDLVADIERLRGLLGIERWQVFGGSWGSTLALAYAERHPDRVSALVLRGIFMLRRAELLWFYQDGASELFPDAWESYLEAIPVAERGDLMSAYHRRLTSPDHVVRLAAAVAWSTWEAATSRLEPDEAKIAEAAEPAFAETFARIECHYFVHGGFFEVDGQLLRDIGAIRRAGIPGVIVQGRYDVVCPMRSAWDLHRAWPEAELIVVPDAGHAATEPGNVDALVRSTDRLRR
jgi:proline iminopeptidase